MTARALNTCKYCTDPHPWLRENEANYGRGASLVGFHRYRGSYGNIEVDTQCI